MSRVKPQRTPRQCTGAAFKRRTRAERAWAWPEQARRPSRTGGWGQEEGFAWWFTTCCARRIESYIAMF